MGLLRLQQVRVVWTFFPFISFFGLLVVLKEKEREKAERIDRREYFFKTFQTTPTRTYCKRNRPLPYYHPPGRVAQSVGHLTRERSRVRYPIWPHTFVSPSADSRGTVVSYRKYVHEVLVNRLVGVRLPRKSVVRLTDRPDMTLDVYRGRKTTT